MINDKYLASIIDNSVIRCNEIIDAVAKSYDKEAKTVSTNFNEKREPVKQKILCFTCFFINYYSIIDSCSYLPLPYNIEQNKSIYYHITPPAN